MEGKEIAKPAPKRVKVKAHTKIDGLQGAYRALPQAYPFGAPLQGSRFVMAGEATSFEEAFRQSREAESRMGYSTGLVLNSRIETQGPTPPPLATRGSQTSTSRPPTTQSDDLFGRTTPVQEMMRGDAHRDAPGEEQLETNRMQRGNHERMDTRPVTAPENEHHISQQLGIARMLKHAHGHASTGDRVGNYCVPQPTTFTDVRVHVTHPKFMVVETPGPVYRRY